MADRPRRFNGDGTMRKRPDGRWEGRISVGYDPATGKRLQQSVYAKTETELRKKMKAALKEWEERKGLPRLSVEQEKITFGEWLDIWLNDYKKNSVSPSTYVSYQNAIENHIKPALGKIKLRELRPEQIQRFLNTQQKSGNAKTDHEGLASWTVLKLKNVINGSLKQALRGGLILRNPTEAIVPPKLQQKDIRVLSVEEQEQFMQALEGHRLEAFFKLALATGMRRGELIALTWDNVDFKNRTINILHSASRQLNHETGKTEIVLTDPKTQTSRRQIPMLESVVPILKEHYEKQQIEKKFFGKGYNPNNLVFCSNVGTFLEPRRINSHFYKLIEKAGIEPINFHALRHTFATRAMENGIHPKIVQSLLGHANSNLTMDVYTHVLPSVAQQEIKKMESVFSKKENMGNGAPISQRKKSKEWER